MTRHLKVSNVIARAAALLFAAIVLASSVLACDPRVDVRYSEDSPDVFRITFVSGQKFELQSLDIDMTSSVGGVHIDDVYDPALTNEKSVAKITKVEDASVGGQTARLIFENFVAGQSVIYWMDLDDQSAAGGADHNHLTSGEIKGTKASAVLRHSNGKLEKIEGVFGSDNKAVLAPRACV